MKDARVASAISHWAPRFVANGVLLSDFDEVTALDHALGGLVRRVVAHAKLHESRHARRLRDRRRLTAAEHFARAACYHFAKFVFVHDPLQMRAAHMKAMECYTARRLSCDRRASA